MTDSGKTEAGVIVPVIREFLYADLDRVRSLLAQRAGGVPEEDRVTESASKKFNLGVKNYLGFGSEGRSEEYVQRSLLDALFPELEALLEAEGWLTDISDTFHDADEQNPERLQSSVPHGSIVRVTAEGYLLDPQYVAQVFGGVSAAVNGVGSLQGKPTPAPKGKGANSSRKSDSTQDKLEDIVEEFRPDVFGGVKPDQLRNFIRLSRGIFSPGLHLVLTGRGKVEWTLSARLQQGRRHLDAEPEILFSRYGTGMQEWTIVGTIGHYARRVEFGDVDSKKMFQGEIINRRYFVQTINDFLSALSSSGFADTPPVPGFSVIPLAVYRTIPRRG